MIAKFSGGDKDQSQAEQAEPKQVESKPHSSQEPVDISDIKPSVNVKAQAEQINAKQTTVPKGMEAALQEFQSLGGNGFALDAPESSKPVQEQSEKQEQSQSHGGKKTIGKFTEMVNSQSAQQSHGMGKGT